MATVTIRDGLTFKCGPDQTIIDAAQESGIILDHSCTSGRCNSCEARVIEGRSRLLQPELSMSNDSSGGAKILMCCRAAETDICLDVEGLTNFERYSPKVLPCKIDTLERVSPDVVELRLRFPPTAKFQFNPGQYVDLKSPGGVVRSYSIANQSPDDALVLHIKNYKGGQMSRYLFDEARPGDLLSVRGPLGTFHLRNRSPGRTVFIATGTGIAPILSMLSLSRDQLIGQEVSVYWGVRAFKDFYCSVKNFDMIDRFRQVLSRSDHPSCMGGYVQEAVLREIDDFRDVVVYACGSTEMINNAHKLFTSAGLEPERFFSDAFVESRKEGFL